MLHLQAQLSPQSPIFSTHPRTEGRGLRCTLRWQSPLSPQSSSLNLSMFYRRPAPFDRRLAAIVRRAGQVNRECAAFAELALHGDPAPVGLHNLANHAESQAAAVDLSGDGFVSAVERFEDVRQVGRWNAQAIIAHRDRDFAATRAGLRLRLQA